LHWARWGKDVLSAEGEISEMCFERKEKHKKGIGLLQLGLARSILVSMIMLWSKMLLSDSDVG